MPRARYTGGGIYRVGGHSFEHGDEREIDRELATHLSDHDDFEITVEKKTVAVDEAPGGGEAEEESDVETCQVEQSNGETCGRELPCQYHSNDSDDEED